MIIDSHAHFCGPPLTADFIDCTTADGSIITLPFRRVDCSLENLLQAMDAHNIDMALVNAFRGALTNEYLSQMVRQHRSRLEGFAGSINR